MASFIRDSKFRNTVTTLTPREQWYEQLKVGDVSTSSDGNGITASSAFLAYVDNAGGAYSIYGNRRSSLLPGTYVSLSFFVFYYV